MSVNKMSIPEKIPLTGSDCFYLVLDKLATKYTAGNNVMRTVVFFDTAIELEKIKTMFDQSAVILWLCNINLWRGSFFSSPCWYYQDKGKKIIIREHHHPNPGEIPETVLKRDIPLHAERFVEADIIRYSTEKCSLVLSWNHILMDGKGIALLLRHLDEICKADTYQNMSSLFPASEKKLSLVRHIKNMYAVKRFVQRTSRPPLVSIASNKMLRSTGFKNKLLAFTKEETQTINQNAIDNGARFGANLFYLACAAHVTNNIIKSRINNPGDLWVPVPYDGRLRGASAPIISNTVAFLFYRISQRALSVVAQTVKAISEQMNNQIKHHRPQKYSLFLNLMRSLPLNLYYFLIRSRNEGNIAAFLYSSTGEIFNDIRVLFGHKVTGLTIYPCPTYPPGLTFSFLKHNDELNINIVYSLDIVNTFEINRLEPELRDLLINKS